MSSQNDTVVKMSQGVEYQPPEYGLAACYFLEASGTWMGNSKADNSGRMEHERVRMRGGHCSTFDIQMRINI